MLEGASDISRGSLNDLTRSIGGLGLNSVGSRYTSNHQNRSVVLPQRIKAWGPLDLMTLHWLPIRTTPLGVQANQRITLTNDRRNP
jgi:hypothetical protein